MSLFLNDDNNDDNSSDGEVDESLLSSLRPEVLEYLATALEVRNNSTTSISDDKDKESSKHTLHPTSNKVFAEKSYWY